MKNRWHLLWNPFSRIAGWHAFAAGIVIVVVTAIVAAYGNLALDGALDAHLGEELTIKDSLLLSLISMGSLILVMLFAGIALRKAYRAQDIVGTFTLARFPMFLLALLALFTTAPELSEMINNPMSIFSYPAFLLFLLLSIPLVVWMVALYYHAFKVSVGAKGPKMVWTFIVALLVAEILSKILIFELL